ncbi:MAG: hypothetical protein IJ787_02640 [Bacilli bacterium]|nr:hypothetical protein [Bacilli bacterium]
MPQTKNNPEKEEAVIFYRLIDIDTKMPLTSTMKKEEIRALVDEYTRDYNVAVETFCPSYFEDEELGIVPFLFHYSATPYRA